MTSLHEVVGLGIRHERGTVMTVMTVMTVN